jgi:hypothetical protein
VLLTSTGSAEGMTDTFRKRFPELETDFSHLTTPTLVVCGDEDGNPVATTRGAGGRPSPTVTWPGSRPPKRFAATHRSAICRSSSPEQPSRLSS